MASGEVATNGGAGVKIGGTVSEPVRQGVRRQIAQGERWSGAEDRNAAANPSGGLTCYPDFPRSQAKPQRMLGFCL